MARMTCFAVFRLAQDKVRGGEDDKEAAVLGGVVDCSYPGFTGLSQSTGALLVFYADIWN
jgi:hypothetical protein